MRRHVREVHGNPERRFQCTVENCNRSFVRGSELTKHVKSVHSQKGVRCTYCKKMYKSERSVKDHQRNHCKMLPEEDEDSDEEEDLNEEQGSDDAKDLDDVQGSVDDQGSDDNQGSEEENE